MNVIEVRFVREGATQTHVIENAIQAQKVLCWLEARGVDGESEIRGFRWKRGGGFSFRHGWGYDWISTDLLCDDASGRACKEFERETRFDIVIR